MGPESVQQINARGDAHHAARSVYWHAEQRPHKPDGSQLDDLLRSQGRFLIAVMASATRDTVRGMNSRNIAWSTAPERRLASRWPATPVQRFASYGQRSDGRPVPRVDRRLAPSFWSIRRIANARASAARSGARVRGTAAVGRRSRRLDPVTSGCGWSSDP